MRRARALHIDQALVRAAAPVQRRIGKRLFKAAVHQNIDCVDGEEESGGGTLDDIGMVVQNAIAETRLEVIPLEDVIDKIFLGEHVLAAEIYISSEKWEGGRTYITLIFYDYDTKQRVAILKSNGMGLSNSQDRNLALRAIRKKLKKVFGEE